MQAVCMIGIAGPSGSGKSEAARAVCARVPSLVLALDHYYLDLSHLPFDERCHQNFDHPESLDWPLIERQLAALKRGESIDRPDYDFATHTRRARRIAVAPASFVLVDGIFALHERVRSLYDTRVFVDLEDEVCLERRIARDVRERGRTRESVIQQYDTTVRPMCQRYVLPSRAFADVVIRGDWPLDRSASEILAHADSPGGFRAAARPA